MPVAGGASSIASGDGGDGGIKERGKGRGGERRSAPSLPLPLSPSQTSGRRAARLGRGRRREGWGRRHGSEEALERIDLPGGLPALHTLAPDHRLARERAALDLAADRLHVVGAARLAALGDVELLAGRGR